jgi:hypothetical protein
MTAEVGAFQATRLSLEPFAVSGPFGDQLPEFFLFGLSRR